MDRVTRIDDEASYRLMSAALPLLTPAAQELVKSVAVFVTAARRGRANWRGRLVRVPTFVFNDTINFAGRGTVAGGDAFAAYYLAHELAHVAAKTGTHSPQFMAAFKELCPPELQWYETLYKPRAAAAAGIVKNSC
jgi:hypothetical protein